MVTASKLFLDGITRPGYSDPINPGEHVPCPMRNRVIVERHTPNGEVHRVIRDGNIMTTYGLNNLAELVASGTQAYSASNGWVRVMAVGTGDAAAASTDVTLANSTASLHISAASMVASDAGNRTLQFNATFDDGNAYTIKEVGLFGTNDASGSAVARTVLAASDQVVKGTGDTVNVSYQVIFTTA